MKNFILKSIALTLLLFASSALFSQDKIHKNDGEVIDCKITELGMEYVNYTQEDTKELIFRVNVNNINKIVFESGKELIYTEGKTVSETTFGEDRIYKKNEEVIICKVTELGEEYVKYTQDDTKELVFAMDVMRIDRVVFASGKEVSFNDKMMDEELYYGQSKNAFKIGLFSPATGALSIGYERSLKPGASVDFSVGFIGIGFNEVNGNNSRGAYFDGGYKFIMTPSYRTSGTTFRHLLRGFYFKPKFAMAMYGRDLYVYNPSTGTNQNIRKDVVAGAFTLDMGWQWIIGDVFLLNMYGGFGYGFDNISSKDFGYQDYYDEPQYHYGFTVGGQIPLAFTAGLKIGFTK
jgi:TATA-box binding protein (TBP) (component of TFIID and TFIIIB)